MFCCFVVDSIDQRDTQSRSLDDFSLLSPSLRRVVMGYHMIPEECNGPTGAGSLPNSVLSPHPSPTLEDLPTLSMSQGSGDSYANSSSHGEDRSQLSADQTSNSSALLTPKKSGSVIVDHIIAALLAVGVAIVLALIILLLGPEQEHHGGSVSLAPVTGELGS